MTPEQKAVIKVREWKLFASEYGTVNHGPPDTGEELYIIWIMWLKRAELTEPVIQAAKVLQKKVKANNRSADHGMMPLAGDHVCVTELDNLQAALEKAGMIDKP